MGIRKADIIPVEINQEWLDDALEYALISWSQTFNRLGTKNLYKRLEKIIIGKICEEATIAALEQKKIKYDLLGRTEWYKIDQYDIGIKNCQADVKANFIDFSSRYMLTKRLRPDESSRKEWFLNCHALVPADQLKSIRHKAKKIFIFVFAVGKFVKFTSIENESASWVHLFWDYRWLKKGEHKQDPSLGKIKIKGIPNKKNNAVVIYGTKTEKSIVREKIVISPTGTVSLNEFHQVFAMRFIGNPTGITITVESEKAKLQEIVKPEAKFIAGEDNSSSPESNFWAGIKLIDEKAYVLGWENESIFRVNGEDFPRYSKSIEQYEDTLIDNVGIPVSNLRPMSELSK